MAIDIDIATFYGNEFTVTATLTHSGVVSSISVIYDRAGAVNVVGGVEVRNAAPTARCKTSDVSTAVRGDTMAISGTTYYIADIEPLNTEEALLHLSLTSP